MERIQPIKAGLAFGVMLGGWHLLWATLVALGWAQTVLNFVFWMHFIRPIYVIEGFQIGIALTLIAITAAIGFAGGYLFARVWNYIQR